MPWSRSKNYSRLSPGWLHLGDRTVSRKTSANIWKCLRFLNYRHYGPLLWWDGEHYAWCPVEAPGTVGWVARSEGGGGGGTLPLPLGHSFTTIPRWEHGLAWVSGSGSCVLVVTRCRHRTDLQDGGDHHGTTNISPASLPHTTTGLYQHTSDQGDWQ